MANIPTGKNLHRIRLKRATIKALAAMAGAAGYHTPNLLTAELVEECVGFLTNPKRSAMPDLLLRLKAQGFDAAPAEPTRVRESAVPAAFTPFQFAAIEDVVRRALAGQKKSGAGRGAGEI